jgi:hypothetical protein
LRFEHVDYLGAYSILSETGLLVLSCGTLRIFPVNFGLPLLRIFIAIADDGVWG